MRQRNDTDQPLLVHTDPPQQVDPGGEVEWDIPIIGLTILDEPVVQAAEPAATTGPTPAGAETAKARRHPPKEAL